MSATPQSWVRAELSGSTGASFGAQLMIPADGLEFHGTDLVFQRQGEVVYVAEAGQLRSVTWLTKQPNPELERRKALWPKHGTRWSEEERAELRRQLAAGETWVQISASHGRSRTGVQQEAVKQGWVDPDTFEFREQEEPAGDSPTDDGLVGDVPAEDGLMGDGPAEDGLTRDDGFDQDAHSRNGPSQDGLVQDDLSQEDQHRAET